MKAIEGFSLNCSRAVYRRTWPQATTTRLARLVLAFGRSQGTLRLGTSSPRLLQNRAWRVNGFGSIRRRRDLLRTRSWAVSGMLWPVGKFDGQERGRLPPRLFLMGS